MAFEILICQSNRGTPKPMLSIKTDGMIAFNAALRAQTKDYPFVEIYHDKETNRLGLKLFTKTTENSCKISRGQFSVRSRFRGVLDFDANYRYPVIKDGEFYVVDLSDGEKIKPRVSRKQE